MPNVEQLGPHGSNVMRSHHVAHQVIRRAAGPPVLCDITNTGCIIEGGKLQPQMIETIKVPNGCDSRPRAETLLMQVPTAARGSCMAPSAQHCAPGLGCDTVPGQENFEDASEDHCMTEDPQQVTEYVAEIYSRFAASERLYMPRPDYMDGQTEINAKMRAILIDWLVEVHLKYKLKNDTLFLSVNLIDRFLALRQLPRKRLQLCGITATLIAAKFEEIYPPEVRDFVYITDNAYRKEDILQMEATMLTVLKFVVCCPTPVHFLERYQRQNCLTEAHLHLMQYVLELCLPELKMVAYAPSHLAAAAALLSNKLLKQHPCWPPSMVELTSQTEPMVRACAREMCGILEAAERSSLQAIRKKYSDPRFSCVATTTW